MQGHRLLGGLLALLGGIAVSCNGSGEDGSGGGGGACIPGQQFECACPGGGLGVQVCDAGGDFLGPCSCDGASGGEVETDGETEFGTADGSGTGEELCGNTFPDPGECDEQSPNYCPEDCGSVDGGTMDTGTGGEGSCSDLPTYVAMVPSVASRWESGALTGFGAGEAMCQMAAAAAGTPNATDVTVCNYQQVLQAEMAGEFAAIPPGTTAWLHRLTVADIGGVPTQPGLGGRCVDWTYSTNHISDGEFVDFPGGGAVNYNLDADTFYDGVDTTHAQPGLLECGSQMRAILCCNPICDSSG